MTATIGSFTQLDTSTPTFHQPTAQRPAAGDGAPDTILSTSSRSRSAAVEPPAVRPSAPKPLRRFPVFPVFPRSTCSLQTRETPEEAAAKQALRLAGRFELNTADTEVLQTALAVAQPSTIDRRVDAAEALCNVLPKSIPHTQRVLLLAQLLAMPLKALPGLGSDLERGMLRLGEAANTHGFATLAALLGAPASNRQVLVTLLGCGLLNDTPTAEGTRLLDAFGAMSSAEGVALQLWCQHLRAPAQVRELVLLPSSERGAYVTRVRAEVATADALEKACAQFVNTYACRTPTKQLLIRVQHYINDDRNFTPIQRAALLQVDPKRESTLRGRLNRALGQLQRAAPRNADTSLSSVCAVAWFSIDQLQDPAQRAACRYVLLMALTAPNPRQTILAKFAA